MDSGKQCFLAAPIFLWIKTWGGDVDQFQSSMAVGIA
jgi:hypothetical protein